MKKINLGIIGCGYWGPNFMRNFRSLKGVYVKYACDLNPERLKHIHFLYPGIITINNHRVVVKDRPRYDIRYKLNCQKIIEAKL